MGRYVYAASCLLTTGQPTGLLKVGFSVDPQDRICQIGHLLPFDFDLIGCFKGGFFSEKAVHMRLRQWRSRGEYFWDVPEVRAALKRMLADQRPHPLVRDKEHGFLDARGFDLKRTIDHLGLQVADVADHMGIDGAYLRNRLKSETAATRTIAAAVSLAAADKGIRTAWPNDFLKRAA